MRLKSRSIGRVCGFDTESHPLSYWFDGNTTAEITAFAWKWVDDEHVHSMLLLSDGRFQCDDGKRITDVKAYLTFADVLNASSLVFGHNIRSFDLPLINAGLLRRSLPVIKPILTTDTLKDYPKRKDMSASLENLATMYGLDDEGGKKHMSIVNWERANKLTPDGVELARERVESDVLLQERLREKLLSLNLLSPPRVWRP